MDNPTLAAGIMGLIGALIGGAIGGFGSYFGGINGSLQAYELMSKREERVAEQSLGKLLDFTCFNIKKTTDSDLSTYLGGLDACLYDPEWPRYIGLISSLNDGERDNVITWLTGMQRLKNRALRGEDLCSADVPEKFKVPHNQEIIMTIAQKLLAGK